ncbi:MAG: MinD/ParA family protein [Pseudobdellovibrionaceae bacterium]
MIPTQFNRRRTNIISVTSGKGGVGKTSLICNLALRFSQLGKKVLILDGDFGMANVDIFFGLRSESGLLDVLNGEKTLKEIIKSPQAGVHVIPGGSGIYEMNHLSNFDRRNLFDQISDIQGYFDYLLIDTAPGLADNVLFLNGSAQTCCVVLTPDPSSFADSYALIKVIRHQFKRKEFHIICNQVKNSQEGVNLFQRFIDVCEQFLDVQLHLLGSVPYDEDVRRATREQRLILKQSELSQASQAIKKLAAQIDERSMKFQNESSWRQFWEQTIGVA